LRVLHVLPSLAVRVGGPALTAAGSALAVRSHGVEVTIFATDMARAVTARRHRAVRAEELPPEVAELDVHLFPVRLPHRLAHSPELGRALARSVTSYDVVHIHSLFLYPQFAAFRHAASNGVPYIVSPSGALDPYLRRRSAFLKTMTDALWQRKMLDGAAALHYKTAEEARLVADLRLIAPARVVPNGLRCADYAVLPPAEPFRAAVGARGPVVLALGRLSWKKGLDVLIRAFAVARKRVVAATLVIAGPDDEGLASGLRHLAHREGVGDDVRFVGLLLGRKKLEALAATDVWALPSYTENFGLAVVEALAAGRAVVVSDAVNLAPAIQAAGAGRVAPAEPGPFGDALTELLLSDDERARLGSAGRRFAARYDWGSVGAEFADLYRFASGSDGRHRSESAHPAFELTPRARGQTDT
jgi:glycosyltransferase involved in cell wall biosynthesis